MSAQSFLYTLVRFRIMPVTMSFLMLLFFVKIYDLAQGTSRLSEMLIAAPAGAEEKAADKAPADPAQPADKKDAAAPADKKETVGKAPAMEKSADKKDTPAPAKPDTTGSASGVVVDSDKTTAPGEKPKDDGDKKDEHHEYTPVEVELLQNLSKRRAELDKYEEEVKMKESLLDATELRINKKIDEMKTLQEAVKKILDQYKQQEDTNIKSLVKMYENMKPKSAARIFNETDMPVLLRIIDQMAEKKAAPILAAMDPKKAKEVTIDLAAERKVLDNSDAVVQDAR